MEPEKTPRMEVGGRSDAAEICHAAEGERLAGHYESARRLGEQAVAAAEQSGERMVLIDALMLLCKVQNVLGDPKAALGASRRATAEAEATGDARLLGTTLYLGVVTKTQLGLQEECLSDIEQALAIATRLNDVELLYWSYNRAGVVQIDLGRHDMADALMQKSLGYGEKLGDEERFCILNNLAENIALWEDRLAESGTHLPTETLERARTCGERALVYARRAGNPYREAMILTTLGPILALLRRFPEALQSIDQGEQIAISHDYRPLRQTALHLRGKTFLLMGNAPAAVDNLEQALALATAFSDDIAARDICRSLATACELVGDAAAALKHYRNHHQIDRKINSAQAELKASLTADRVALMGARVEAEQAEAARQRLAEKSAKLESSIRSLAEAAEQADRKAQTDALTGLYNRHFLNAELPLRVERAQELRIPLTLALVDADHFKTVNDRFGHAGGDKVLQVLGEILRRGMRAGDIAVRYGGEEILLLLGEVQAKAAATICERLRGEIETYAWDSVAKGLQVTASFGIATLMPEDTVESFVAHADAALYAAKNSGRNRVTVFQGSGPDSAAWTLATARAQSSRA
jgi:diguanylate cyclase (GGDEF)-like protein